MSELEGTHKDHQLQLLGSQRTTPQKNKKSYHVSENIAKCFLNPNRFSVMTAYFPGEPVQVTG